MNSTDDVVELSESNDEDCVLESVIYQEPINEINFDSICAENPLLARFINICLNLENSAGMARAIHKTLLRIYTKADKEFIKSKEFEKALRRATNLMKCNPSHKFSHLKDLCNILKYGKVKKRVQLITLSSNLKENKLPPTLSNNNSIDLIEDSTIDLDTLPDESFNEKENHSIITCSQSSAEGEKLLVPQKILEFEETNKEQIEKIEREIAMHKDILAKLDEEEVCFDSVTSPYVKSEKIKEKIVSLYKELCNLTGAEPVKKRKIHLKVIDGHPPGPVRRLEKFLNRNTGADGHPPFPNFRDVVKCVVKANEKDSLGWSRQQVMREAAALFTHCGRALQKRRQKREWHDLLSKVKREQCDDDPADNDPELQARLEANRRIGLKKELEVLERFTMMQNGALKTTTNVLSEVQMEGSDSDIDSSSDESNVEAQENNLSSQLATTSHNIIDTDIDIKEETSMYVDNEEITNNSVANIKQEEIPNCENTANVSVVKIKKEQISNIIDKLEELGDNYTTTIVEIEDPFVTVEISDSSDEESA